MIHFCLGPGGEVLPYKSHIGMRRHWVGFLRRFGLKTGMHFTDFDLKSGWVFEGTTREICEFEMDWKNFCVCALTAK